MLWLGEVACHDVMRAGGKAANLSRLAARFPVPTGFCVTADVLAALRGDAAALPAALHDEIVAAYALLGQNTGQPKPGVAVRSSACDEDGGSASFAGQLETLLNIVGQDAVAGAVLLCYRSAFSPRVQRYRMAKGLSATGLRAAVLVQWLVPAEVSGVAFSRHPITGADTHVVINASFGLGESIVSGCVTPDAFIVTKGTFSVVERVLGDKDVMIVAAPEGTKEVPVPNDLRSVLCLDDARAAEVARLAAALEGAMGWAVDIEWAYHGAKLYLLQCRPVTTS